MYDVITFGSSTIDVFASVESELIKIKSIHHSEELIAYPCGSKILIDNLEFFTGGGGTNTAVALARLGLKVGYVGKIGDDENSNSILRKLSREKVDFLGVRTRGHSGYSIVLESIEGDRTILTYKGVNNDLLFSELDKERLKARWFYFSSMVGKSFETLEKLTEFAARNKIKIAFNPSNYLAEKGYLYLKKIIDNSSLLIMNKEESFLITRKNTIKDSIKKLYSYSRAMVIITDGKQGAYLYEKDKIIHIKPTKVSVRDTTGAGDAFASTFLGMLLLKNPTRKALSLALLNAESVIGKRGAKNGLLTYSQLLQKYLKKKPSLKILK